MAAALECWSSRTSTDEDMVDQVLMRTNDRSECPPGNNPPSSAPSSSAAAAALRESSLLQKRFQKLGRNVSEAIASLKNTLNISSDREAPPPLSSPSSCRRHVWGTVVRSLTQLYPGSQLPEKLVSNIRKHYDSLPLSYAQAGFEMKDVFLHIKLIEQVSADDHPAIMIQEMPGEEGDSSMFKLTFACNSAISWPSMSGALDSSSICSRKLQIFEKKGFTLGIVTLLVQAGQEKMFTTQVENALQSSIKKPKNNPMKLHFGLCGCQEQSTKGRDLVDIEEDCKEHSYRYGGENSDPKIELKMPLPDGSIVVSVDEWQTVISGRDGIGNWLLNQESVEITDQLGPSTFKGTYKGKKVWIEKLKGCDKGDAYEFELRRDLLELMTCGHRNIIQFYGVCVDENHGLCAVTKLMQGGSVYELIVRNKKIKTPDILRIIADVAEGIKFMNDHGVAYRDLNTQRILLDKRGNACLGDMGIVSVCKSCVEVMEYETDGYRWLAPEIISGDPESVTETWMSNAYSFAMVVWELLSGEIAYSAYSPVQAAVGIAACGLRPAIPEACPHILQTLMINCWNNCPSKRPQFSEIVSTCSRLLNNNVNTGK